MSKMKYVYFFGGKKADGNTGVVNPNKPSPKAVPVNIDNPIVEEAIREELTNEDGEWIGEFPTGELTKADLERTRPASHYPDLLQNCAVRA